MGWLIIIYDEFFLPTYEEDISIEVRTAYLSCQRDISLFWKDYAVDIILEVVVLISLCLKSSSHLLLTHTFAFSDICRVQRRISGDNNRTRDYIWPLLCWFLDAAVKFLLVEDLVIVNNTDQSCWFLYQNPTLFLQFFEFVVFEVLEKMMEKEILWDIEAICERFYGKREGIFRLFLVVENGK